MRQFEHPVAFWSGVVACVTGVGLHLPMYFGSRAMGYHLAGMRPDAAMITGMVLIFAGLPLAGITGTVIGSLLWGWIGDRIGRRASIMFAGLLFVSTSICGAMPGFQWNLLMCFLMGIGAGGMLPIAFTLIAEIVPARHRG